MLDVPTAALSHHRLLLLDLNIVERAIGVRVGECLGERTQHNDRICFRVAEWGERRATRRGDACGEETL